MVYIHYFCEEEERHHLCVVCGALVGYVEAHGHNLHLEELGIDPENLLEWSSKCRIIAQPGERCSYQLSGIGRFSCKYQNTLMVHWDPESSSIDYRAQQEGAVDLNATAVRIRNFIDSLHQNQYPGGYIVHASCWTLLERVVGRTETNLDLKLLLQILRERFHENPFDIDQYVQGETSRNYFLESTTVREEMKAKTGSTPTLCWATPPNMDLIMEPIDKSIEFRRRAGRKEDDEFTRDVVSLRDPLDIPGLRDLVRKSRRNKARSAMRRKTRRWSIDSSPRQDQMKISPCLRAARRCPTEVIYMILDRLERASHIEYALAAFGWKVPDSYWKSRVPKILHFELEETASNNMDFKYFFKGYEAFLDGLPELKNRERVMDLVEEVKRRFLARDQLAQ